MAQVNISDLNEKTTLEDSDVFLVEGSLATYKITKKKLEEELNTGGSIEGTVDLSDYYNKQEIDTQFENIAKKIEEGGVGGKGEDGVGIQSVVQTTTSTEDGGSNVITVTKTDSTTSTFTVKNGSKGVKGDSGISVTVSNVTESTTDGGSNVITFSDGKTVTIKNGTKGSKGDTGATGATGAKGDKGDTGEKGDKGDKGDSYILTASDKTEIAEKVEGVTLLQAPSFVDDISKMTDTSKTYVLSTTGEIYAYMNTTTIETITKNITATTDNPYTDNSRLASDGSVATGYSGYVTTPYIDLTEYPIPFTLHLDGGIFIPTASETYTKICTYTADKSKISTGTLYAISAKSYLNVSDADLVYSDEGVASIKFTKYPQTNNANNDGVLKYVRFSGKGTSANSSIYVTYQGEVTGGHWVNTGATYSPTITEETKTEIANMVADMIDTQMLDIIGNGEVSV